MKKLIYILSFCIMIFLILINSYDIMENIRFSFSICINNLFPSLIPFMLLSNILIRYDFVKDLSDLLAPFMKLFKVNKNCAFAVIMSILSGTPSNSKYLKDLLDNNLISIEDVKKCLNFCHFTNPIFILGTVGYTFLGNKKLGLIILISHFLSGIIIGIFNRKSKIENSNTYIKSNKVKKNFITVLKESINSTTNTLFLILGIITTCIIITGIFDNILSINKDFKFLYGLIEVTQGLKYLSLSNLSIKLKAIISSFLVSFGGFCIHAQVFAIQDNKKIRYMPYLVSRIIQAFISSILTYFLIELY